MIDLPSGSKLEITQTPFKISKALYQVLVSEVKDVEISSKADLFGLFRGVFLNSMASSRVEAALEPCLSYALYNGLKIDKDTFEKNENREDYPTVCLEVAHYNVYPFLKNLSAQYTRMLEKIGSGPK